jgi:hypothetical protein
VEQLRVQSRVGRKDFPDRHAIARCDVPHRVVLLDGVDDRRPWSNFRDRRMAAGDDKGLTSHQPLGIDAGIGVHHRLYGDAVCGRNIPEGVVRSNGVIDRGSGCGGCR